VKWSLFEGEEELSRAAAKIMLDALDENPALVLGLPTGRTPSGMYAQVVKACGTSRHCFSSAVTFNLDEYVGLERDDPASYCSYMRHHLFEHVDVDSRNIHVPDGTASVARNEHPGVTFDEALDIECRRYERAISRAGSLQLTFLGIGSNGHIGFNEPGAPFDSRTRVVELSESTRKANSRYFSGREVPTRAITIGIGTILESARVILLASGESKREAMRRLRSGEITPDFPASALLRHHDVTILADRAAAGD
jgi:glucosamine-6-phosphate deaminase